MGLAAVWKLRAEAVSGIPLEAVGRWAGVKSGGTGNGTGMHWGCSGKTREEGEDRMILLCFHSAII